MVQFHIEETLCKGCELCVRACPKQLLKLSPDKLNAKGYHPVMITNVEACIACGSCFRTCPDTAFTIRREA